MNIPLPAEVVNAEEWDQYLIENVPALATLHKQGADGQYETYKALAGLSYGDYRRVSMDRIAASILLPMVKRAVRSTLIDSLVSVQPMTAPADTIFKLKTLYTKEGDV
jgi:hypothetical protein